jgi:hypothetical protein
VKRAVRGLHDLRLGVGEVALVAGLRRKRVAAARRATRMLSALDQLRPAAPLALSGLGFQGLLGLAGALKAPLPAGQLIGQLVAAAIGSEAVVLCPVYLLGLRERRLGLGADRGDLDLQLHLGLDHPLVAHRLVARGVRPEPGAVEGQRAELHEPRLAAEAQRLHKQRRQRLKVAAAQARDRAVPGC